MKKIISILISCVILLSVTSGLNLTVYAAITSTGTCGENLTYKYDNVTQTLTISGTGPMTEFKRSSGTEWEYLKGNIENIHMDYGVTSISDYAFEHCSALKGVTIPNSVISIGKSAFQSCGSIFSSNFSITIPNSVTSIGIKAFYHCLNLKNIIMSNSITSISDDMFESCTSLTAITLPNSITSIGNYAFNNCTSLTDITLPNSMTSIGNFAFSGCTSLTNINIPESVTYIGKAAFAKCNNLIHFSVDEENSTYIYENYALFNKNKTELKEIIPNLISDYVIPDSVTNIGDYAFYNCTNLATVIIPDSVISVGDYVFYSCTSLESVTIPDSVISIGDYVFSECSSLISATISNAIKSMSDYIFYNCISLETVIIPDSVISIGDYAFYKCTSLESVTIPDSVTNIGRSTFSNCTSLRKIIIPNSVIKINDFAFYSCESLTDITLPNSITSIGSNAFSCCLSLKSITIPNSVISISYGMFKSCKSLTNITLPNSITSIDNYAFNSCTNLTAITLPNSITSIGNYAFNNCTSLTDITLPNSMTSIGNFAFSGCTSLTNINIPESVTYIGKAAFAKCNNLIHFSVDEENSTYIYENYALFNKNKTELKEIIPNLISDYVIPDSVTNIGDYAFYNCTNLAKVIIPDSVISIGNYAFYGCNNLIDILYIGTVKQWNNVSIDKNNEILASSKMHYCYYTVKNPTCKEQGYTTYTCTNCGNTYKDNYVVTVEHSFKYYKYNNDATCTTDGTQTAICEYGCGTENTITAPNTAIGHNLDNGEIIKEPTCTAEGSMVKKCTNKGCDYQEMISISTIEHTWSDWKYNNDAVYNSPTDYKNGTQTRICTTCGENETVEAPNTGLLRINTVSLSLESSITMNFKVFKNSLSSFDDFYMTFECGGKEEKVTNYKQDGNYYVFSYKGINPQLMNDKVIAVLHAKNSNGEYTSPEKVMSVREYAYTMLDRYSSDEHSKLRTLLVDLLNYGSATQKYVGYQTDNLANSDLTATQKSWASKDTKEFKNIRNFNYKTISNPTVQWNSCGLVLGNAIMFKVKFTANNVENKTVEITLRNAKFTYDKNDFKDNGDGTYYVYCNELFAHEVSDEVLLTVYENGVPCSNTMRFSVESYARLVRDNYKGTPLDEMITTMMLYGNSAKEYKNV